MGTHTSDVNGIDKWNVLINSDDAPFSSLFSSLHWWNEWNGIDSNKKARKEKSSLLAESNDNPLLFFDCVIFLVIKSETIFFRLDGKNWAVGRIFLDFVLTSSEHYSIYLDP